MSDMDRTKQQDTTGRTPGRDADRDRDANRDPITGAPGSHPVGTGIGAAAGGAAAGAAGGAIAGPVGAAAGAVIGAVAGGLAGKAAGEAVNPTAEDAYWRENYPKSAYYDPAVSYDDDYAPAYRYGWESYGRYGQGRSFDQAEPELQANWQTSRGRSSLDWTRARAAARDAWHRVERNLPGDADGDGI